LDSTTVDLIENLLLRDGMGASADAVSQILLRPNDVALNVNKRRSGGTP